MSAISEIPTFYSPASVRTTTKTWDGSGQTIQTVSTSTEFADSLGGPTGLSEEIAIVYYTQAVVYVSAYTSPGPPVESSETALETATALTAEETSSTTAGTLATSPYPSADGAGATIPDQGKAHSTTSPSVGAIAGGVVGGVIVLAVFAAIVFFLMRRKRRQMNPQMPEMQRYPVTDRGSSSEMERVL